MAETLELAALPLDKKSEKIFESPGEFYCG